jgi:hypothetical protein
LISENEDKIRFHDRRDNENPIQCQKRKIISDSMSGKEENMKFDVRRGR